jgi:hypothetical protein
MHEKMCHRVIINGSVLKYAYAMTVSECPLQEKERKRKKMLANIT